MKENKRTDDFDFQQCLTYVDGVKLEDVEDVLACLFGENDGPDWHYIFKLKDGRYGYVSAGCDYTGWGCQAGGSGNIYDTLEEAIMAAPEEVEFYKEVKAREQLRAQVEGKQPYGLQI